MIEQIKQALEESNLVRGVAGVPSAEKDEWLRYLLGEVEQLQSELDTWVGKTDRWVEETDNRQIEIEKLQKALEQIANYTNPTGEDGREMTDIARQALERTKP